MLISKKRILSGFKFFKQSNLNPISLIVDFLSMKRKKGITFNEYYNYQFDNNSDLFKNSFLGKNEQRIYLDYLNYYTGSDGKIYKNNERAKSRKLCSIRIFLKYYYLLLII